MSDALRGYLYRTLVTAAGRRFASHRSAVRACFIAAGVAMLLWSTVGIVAAASFQQGVSAFNRQDYVSASQIFIPLAEQGVAAAQSYLGFMFETGRGVPQNYTEAAMWYRRAAEQGDSLAQYSLGLLYDQGSWRAAGYRRGQQMAQSFHRRCAPAAPGKHARAFAMP